MFELEIRDIKIKDLEEYIYWKHPDREHHKYNGPYFKRKSEDELLKEVKEIRSKINNGDQRPLKNSRLVTNKNNGEMIGEVNWYWKSQETLWMEVGIVIFNDNYWGQGIGYSALKMWIDEVFHKNPGIIRLGLTTWSGNIRMMGLAEKLGFKKEAVYRKARIVDGKYFDSISYGILRDEWNA